MTKKIIGALLLLELVLGGASTYAQEWKFYYGKGHQAYQQNNYEAARNYWVRYLSMCRSECSEGGRSTLMQLEDQIRDMPVPKEKILIKKKENKNRRVLKERKRDVSDILIKAEQAETNGQYELAHRLYEVALQVHKGDQMILKKLRNNQKRMESDE